MSLRTLRAANLLLVLVVFAGATTHAEARLRTGAEVKTHSGSISIGRRSGRSLRDQSGTDRRTRTGPRYLGRRGRTVSRRPVRSYAPGYPAPYHGGVTAVYGGAYAPVTYRSSAMLGVPLSRGITRVGSAVTSRSRSRSRAPVRAATPSRGGVRRAPENPMLQRARRQAGAIRQRLQGNR